MVNDWNITQERFDLPAGGDASVYADYAVLVGDASVWQADLADLAQAGGQRAGTEQPVPHGGGQQRRGGRQPARGKGRRKDC